ncbi:IS66 family insertion sequence element accessory protein TnpB [Sphingobium sp. Ant17]|uniref:IS66 family insertion sequence element accessory protein TnpB n=1 Tax=Sphingobium sp. Ant17 TaxID=1461752 RepID=UPI0004B7B5C8|nr:IS66 family insertion sequence element accessory protein TnpB [Sphingobium sp. Ant17]
MPSDAKIWIALGHTDMRRGMRGLALQVQESLKRDPHQGGSVHFSGGRSGSLIKIFVARRFSACRLYAKRLEKGAFFVWPSAKDGTVPISASALACLLEGIDWRNPQKAWRPSKVG